MFQTLRHFCFPPLPSSVATAPSMSGYTLDASGEKLAAIFQAPATGTIRKLLWNVGTVTTSGPYDGRLESVDDTSGHPSGTLLAASAAVGITVSATGWNTWDFGAGNGAAVTVGDRMAALVASTGSGSILLRTFADMLGSNNFAFPYLDQFTVPPSSWTKVDQSPMLSLEYSDGSYYPIPAFYPGTDANVMTWTSASNPKKRGLRFKFPFPVRISGIWAWQGGAAGNTWKFELFDVDGKTALATYTHDSDDLRANGNALLSWYLFASQIALAKDTFYRLAVTPQSSVNTFLGYLDLPSATVLDALSGGQIFHYTTTNTDPPTAEGDWTQTTTRYPFLGLILDGFDDGAGALRRHPGMSGGMVG